MNCLQTKRIYESPSADDGFRILIDRLWPRGVSKEEAKLNLWLKEIAPSNELRKWFDHKPERFKEFSKRYKAELTDNPAVKQLEQVIKENPVVTLLYSAHDPELNQAIVLLAFLKEHR